MSTIYAYNNELWKVKHSFAYTGGYQQFTLDPGRYLIICNGGKVPNDSAVANTSINYGGTAAGILNLEEQQTLYATVGGDGVEPQSTGSFPPQPGFNGGGMGGGRYSTSYKWGSSGAGGSDVRLQAPSDFPSSLNKTRLPARGVYQYQECEWINPNGTYINFNYTPSSNTTIEVKVSALGTTNSMYVFGQRYNATSKQFAFILDSATYTQSTTNVNACFLYGTMSGSDPPVVNPGVDITEPNVYRMNREGLWVNGEKIQTIEDPVDTLDTRQLLFFVLRNSTSVQSSTYFYGRVYEIKIYEGEELLHHYIPCYERWSGNAVFYDLIPETGTVTYTFNSVTTPTCGPDLMDGRETKSYLTRFIVAGGGGGATEISPSSSVIGYGGVGGGWHGGPICCGGSVASNGKYAHATNGWAFGYGQNSTRNGKNGTGAYHGAGGGGGGWYGGYAITETVNWSSGNGGGGSSFILTEDTVENVPNGYDVPSTFYMEHVFTSAGIALESGVIVCEPATELEEGDVIKAFATGEAQHIAFPPGKYLLKCWGAAGGSSYALEDGSAGGYAEGLLTLRGPNTLHLYVGGTGGFDIFMNPADVRRYMNPAYAFNGGGVPPTSMQVYKLHAGGGGTDIRIGHDSLYSRVIVAGGGGGRGGYTSGSGGGLTGTVSANTGYGTNSGAGTQTNSPQSVLYPVINGGFGFGGSCNDGGTDYTRGTCGGGGWYGGSGTYQPNSSSVSSGSGGSGYVLTAESFKPENYMLGEEYYLEDTVLTTGGNNLGKLQSKIEIEVVDTKVFKMICRDIYGLKYYDSEEERWALIPDTTAETEVTPELCMEYGSIGFSSDAGLADTFEIIVYDPSDVASHAVLNVTPNKQTITHTKYTNMYVKDIKRDVDADPSVYDCNIRSERIPDGVNTRIVTTVEVDKRVPEATKQFKMYYVSYSSE